MHVYQSWGVFARGTHTFAGHFGHVRQRNAEVVDGVGGTGAVRVWVSVYLIDEVWERRIESVALCKHTRLIKCNNNANIDKLYFSLCLQTAD